MLEIKNVSLDSTNLDRITIRWEINSTREDSFKYAYEVYRGESSGGPFEKIAGPLVDRFMAVDNIAPRKSSWRNLYYVIRVVGPTGEYKESSPISLNARIPFEALEMVRLHSMLLKEYTGRPCLVFPLRTFGQRCTCFDPVSSRRQVTSCLTCFNTGFVRGYHYPILSYVAINSYEKSKGVNEVMIIQQAQTMASMSIDPLVKVGDLIVEREGVRWRVQSVSTTERLRSPVHQEISLHKVSEGDIEFKMPIDWPQEYKTSPRSYEPKMDIGD
jgi:hypothetical protein